MSAIPARCNRRPCQARRNLSKHPEEYARWPTCHVNGCSGKMYVDKYRLRKGPHDLPPVCRDSACRWTPANLKNWRQPMHRVNTEGCSGYEDWKLDRALAASKHRPNKPSQDEQAPF